MVADGVFVEAVHECSAVRLYRDPALAVERNDRFADDGAINASFITDLSATIAEHQPALWIHGHVHDSHDYTVGETRIVCNPHGYSRGNGLVENAGFVKDFIVEIPTWSPRLRP